MTDIRKLAAKHARKVEPDAQKLVGAVLVTALREYQKSAVIDVVQGSPSAQLVAERIARARPMPPVANYSPSAAIARQITYRDILAYAVEQGRELERQSRPEAQLEYGWEWVSGINSGTFPIHGSDSKESAERAMADTGNRIAPVRIMVREKAVAGPWREA